MEQITGSTARLQFLTRIAERERRHLLATDQRLFEKPFTIERARALENLTEESERVDAFVARFGRLQDTLGDKLISALLRALGERVGPAIDNLDRAERFGWIPSSDDWFAVRKLHNQMVHEYIEDPAVLADALQRGHRYVPVLAQVTDNLILTTKEKVWRRSD
ncbi:hypothetical protein [Halorhodospira halochloris]|uniref:hypothetical protein n=1 Tax=Halorhodospira halochloris TaxID=1052 RepID=UPI000BBA97DC|nr:hypothetical protein [Halorhodospira halochloris]MBK1652927.1 hypothetical protein [Halorhodospira halochloris]